MKTVHMMGIGGIGMSAIARLLILRGDKVTGCDAKLNALTEKLKSMGAVIYEGHNPGHIDSSVDLVVYSSAIKENHSELENARSRSIPIYRRAQMLADVAGDSPIIAVTGTHGKTTTSFMITHIMSNAGLGPSFAIGGEMDEAGGNAGKGEGRYFVVEADESDGTQVYLVPHIAVITNIDLDHMEYYSSISDISKVMRRFADKIPENGLIVGFGDDPEVVDIMKKSKRKYMSYGFNSNNDIYTEDVKLKPSGSKFDIWHKGSNFGTVNLNIPGRHNVLNAMAAAGVCLWIGVSFSNIASFLGSYPGVKRRLDVVYKNNEITVLDDYAHHPNEIRAVISTVRKMADRRLIGVFQPHRFTRTKSLFSSFKDCFVGLDELILTDIYPAGENPIPGISGRTIYNEVVKCGEPNTVYIEDKDNIKEYLTPKLHSGDTVVFMGAGDITEIAHSFGR